MFHYRSFVVLNVVVWREHTRNGPSDLAPYQKRNVHLDRDTKRHDLDARVGVPVHVPHHLETEAIQFLQCRHTWTINDMVNAKLIAHTVKISLTLRQIIVAVVGDQQGVHSILMFHDPRLPVAVFSTADRNNTVIIRPVRSTVLLDQFLENLSPFLPKFIIRHF